MGGREERVGEGRDEARWGGEGWRLRRGKSFREKEGGEARRRNMRFAELRHSGTDSASPHPTPANA